MRWRGYEPPADPEPEDPTPAEEWPVIKHARTPRPSYSTPRRGAAPPRRAVVASGRPPGGARAAIAIVGAVIAIGVGVGVGAAGGPSPESDYSGFYDCIAEEAADGDSGLLSPAELCEIGHERPPGFVDDDDPAWEDGFGSDEEDFWQP